MNGEVNGLVDVSTPVMVVWIAYAVSQSQDASKRCIVILQASPEAERLAQE